MGSTMTTAKALVLLPLLVYSVTAVTLQCSGSTSNSCRGKQCSVTCSDGNKVDLFCEEGGVSISSTNNFAGGRSSVDVQCGQKIKFKACFPFCGLESPILSPSKPATPIRSGSSTSFRPQPSPAAPIRTGSSFPKNFGVFNPFALPIRAPTSSCPAVSRPSSNNRFQNFNPFADNFNPFAGSGFPFGR